MTDMTNPPAFPRFVPEGHYNGSVDVPGLSARAYFAAHAPITVKDAMDYLRTIEAGAFRDFTTVFRTLAQMRLAYADEMLKAGAV